jgi:hypothetical protein
MESVQRVKKIQYVYLLKKIHKMGCWRVAVCPSYILDARFLKVNQILQFVNSSLARKSEEEYLCVSLCLCLKKNFLST